MAGICFFMLPEPGHLNGPIKLAKSLKTCGHQPYFMGAPNSEIYIRREGLDFIPVLKSLANRPSDLSSLMGFILREMGRQEASRSELQTLLAEAIETIDTREARQAAKLELDLMVERLLEIKPDLLFADYFLLPIAFVTAKVGINTAILNPIMIDYPLTQGPPIDFLSILKMPVVYICPQEFDFPRPEPKGYRRYYIGPCVDLERKREKFLLGHMKEGQPYLFCSFGSQSQRYAKAKELIQTVIDAMVFKPEWQLIISLSDYLTAEKFRSVPSNVHLLNMPPQLEILKRASIMITHGGLNSIKECILFGVPMIVIPFDIDQPFNAIKVKYHGLGLVGNPATISAKELSSMIERMEKDPSFKTRVDLMGKRFGEIENSGVGVKTVESLLGKSSC